MTPVWVTLAFEMLLLAGVALVVGVVQGAAAGWAVAALAMLGYVIHHVRQVLLIENWLKTADSDTLPDPWGAWGRVYSSVYAALRREAGRRDAVQAELDMFTQAVHALPDGVALLDSADQLLWCNGTSAAHLGFSPERDIGLRITNLVRVPGLAAFLRNTGAPGALEYHPAELPGQPPGQVLSLKVVPFGDERKLLVSFDITQIVRADTTRRDFIANVSHELRTPLTVIHGFLEHMNEAPAVPGEAPRRHIQLMAQQSDRMLKLVDDLLMLSRLEGGDSPPREEAVDVHTLALALAEDGRALSAGRHTLIVEVPAEAMAKGTEDELRSAFGNLVSNAVRYTPAGGRITLRWHVDEQGRGVFGVADTGIGIDAEHIPRLTERFYRVDRGRSRETGGTGLGLAIVKHVLLRHQAHLDIESEPGKGSEFRVILPRWRTLSTSVSSAAA